MQGFAEKKKEEHKQEDKKQPLACRPIALSMSEGPMMLSDGSKVEAAGRASFEKSVKIEIAAMNMRRKKKAPEKGKGKKRKGDEKPPKK